MYVVRNTMTGRALTSTTDRRRADLLRSGFEQVRVQSDLNGGSLYWHVPTLRYNQVHPYDASAVEQLQAEFLELRDAHLAGCNA